MRKTPIILLVMVLMLVALLAGTAMAGPSDGKLEVTEITIDVNGDEETDDFEGSVDVPPEAQISVKIEVTSNFDDDFEEEDVEIKNVEVEGTIYDVDDDDIEDSADDFDLDPGKHKSVTLNFDMPLRLETDEVYELEIIVNAEDENDTEYEIVLQYDLEVDKENDEIRFLQKEVYPSSVKPGNAAQVRVELINTGEDDQEVTFTVEATDLGFSYSEEFDLVEDVFDDENEFSYNGYLPVKKGTAAGTYPVHVKAVYNDGRDFLDETLNLVVEEDTTAPEPTPTPTPTTAPAPEPEEDEEEEEEEVEVVSQPTTTTTSYAMPSSSAAVATPRTSYGSASKDSWWDRNKWITIILVTDLILLIIGVAIVLAVLRRRRG